MTIHSFYSAYGKRWIDLALTVPTLILIAPLLAIIACAVRLRLGSPIFFRQTRAGRHGAPFTLVKFRSMTMAGDETGALLPDAQRLTRLGDWLRSTSLDELPELWNVLRGEMSLVGPRPLLMEYLPRYAPEHARRHDVKPGLTGWTQVNGRNALSWQQKFDLDVWYVDHLSFRFDMKIMLLTLPAILARRGITSTGQASGQKFEPASSEPCAS